MSLLTARRSLRVAAGAVAGIAVALIGLWLGVPAAARWGIETVGSREVGRAVRVGDVRFNPFTLRLAVNDLAVAGAAGESAPLVSIKELRAAVSLRSLLRAAPVVRQVDVQSLHANVARTAPNRFNFSDIVDRMLARPASPEPARFAIYNITVSDSRIDFDDQVLKSRHVVDAIRIGIPFVSSLPDDIEVNVQPSFAARVDGTPLALTGTTRPFDESLESTLQLKLDGLELPKYLPFAPVRPNFSIPSGKLDTDLEFVFRRATPAREQKPARNAEILLAGKLAVREFSLRAPAGSGAVPLLGFKQLAIDLEHLAPLANRVVVRNVQVDAPEVWVRRSSDGSINWQALATRPLLDAPQTQTSAASAPPPPWSARLARLALDNGIVHVIDDAIGGVAIDLIDLGIDANALSTSDAPGNVKLAARTRNDERLAIAAQLKLAPLSGMAEVSLDDFRLNTAEPYVAAAINGTLAGKLGARAKVEFAADLELSVKISEAAVDASGIRVRGPAGSNAAADLAALSLTGGAIDLQQRTIAFDRAAVTGLRAQIFRHESGELGWMRLLKGGASPAPASPAAAAAGDWKFKLNEATLERGDVIFEDAAFQPSVRLRAHGIAANARNITGDGSERADFSLRTTLGSGGTLALVGNARWDKPAATVRIDARNADIALVRPYLAQYINASLASVELSARGVVNLAVPGKNIPARASYAGNLRLANLRLLDLDGQEELLRWQALDIDKLEARIGEGAPLVELGAINLADFYARIIVSAEGRLNLADIIRRERVAEDRAADKGGKPAVPEQPAPAADAPTIRIGRIDVTRGNVNFTDNFIRPNYTANLTGLTGGVSALASDRAEPATLTLAGKVDDEAPVEIGGRLNPLAPKLFLDISASTKGVDLPRFSPYSAKYAGYQIIKGKLSMDVQYKVEEGKLNAQNHLFLDQLTFGDRVESATATKLPVLLAVALLKNSRGEIDIRLPISGTLDDPQFSVGGIIVQVIVNLLTKIVTAPFALLASAFGGGEEIGYVEFDPGSARIAPEQAKRIETLARALADRPALRLDIIGRAIPTADTEGVKRARYEAKLRAAKVRRLIRAGGESIDPDKVSIEAEERPALIAAVYAEEKIPDKPRNVIGIAKTIPAPEMEALILTHTPVAPEDLRALANQRAAAVRNALEQQGKIDRERLFLVEPKLTAEGIQDKGRTTRVDFTLK